VLTFFQTPETVTFRCVDDGDFEKVYAEGRLLSYLRKDSKSKVFCAFNLSENEAEFDLPNGFENAEIRLDGEIKNGKAYVKPVSCCISVK